MALAEEAEAWIRQCQVFLSADSSSLSLGNLLSLTLLSVSCNFFGSVNSNGLINRVRWSLT